MATAVKIPQAFFWKRMHSLTGLWIAIYLIEHLLTNSQAALWVGDDGAGFVHAVNAIQNLPYLKAIEIFLLGMPILVHAVWGISYLRTGVMNSFPSDGSKPSLTQFPRNHAYTWQRITAWVLLVAIAGHVIQMRFLEYPIHTKVGDKTYFMVRVGLDDGLYTLSQRLNFEIYDQRRIGAEASRGEGANTSKATNPESLISQQKQQQEKAFAESLKRWSLRTDQVVIVADNFGTAEIMMVRETFKMPLMIALYTLFVLSACFHGFNGLWTFLISWGVTLTVRSQAIMRTFSTVLMCLVAFFGLAAIFGTYWINLKA